MRRDTWRRAALIVLWPVGLAAAAGFLVVALSDERAAGYELEVVLSALAGASFIASGLITARRQPRNRLGPLMVVLGFLWVFGQLLSFSGSQLIFTVGLFSNDAWVVPLAYVLVSFPSGRVPGTLDRATIAVFAFAAVPLEFIWLLFFDPGPPGNALQVWDRPDIADAIDWAQRALFTAASIVVAGILAHRWYHASAPLRRRLTPILAGALTIVLSDVNLVVDKFFGRATPRALQIAVLCALIAIPIAVLIDMLRARLARSAIGDLVVALRRDPSPDALREALARALGDPALRVVYWLPEYDGYADAEGRPVALPDDPSRVTTMVDRTGARVAALLHDPFLRDEPERLDAVGAAAGFALENARLHAEVLAGVEELRGARVRVVEAAHSERRRLERDLHDGAQQRLVSLSLQLGMLETRFGGDPEARRALAAVRGELGESLNELRELARGIHPAVVAGHGLEVALEGLAARAPVPVRVAVELDGRLPEPVEVAAYFLVAECLTNVAKYACATTASIAVTRADGDVVVEVADDGVGGANAAAGSGLRGMVDRVEALGGHLELDSPAGDGTRMRAQIPCG